MCCTSAWTWRSQSWRSARCPAGVWGVSREPSVAGIWKSFPSYWQPVPVLIHAEYTAGLFFIPEGAYWLICTVKYLSISMWKTRVSCQAQLVEFLVSGESSFRLVSPKNCASWCQLKLEFLNCFNFFFLVFETRHFFFLFSLFVKATVLPCCL